MTKRERQKQRARINRLKKHGFSDSEINELIAGFTEYGIKIFLHRIKKQGRLG